jgi:hypothetical protein
VITQADLDAARAELLAKSSETIEGETAVKWGARALAAWELAAKSRADAATYVHWFKEAVVYKHEALEHASCAQVGLLDTLRYQLRDVP